MKKIEISQKEMFLILNCFLRGTKYNNGITVLNYHCFINTKTLSKLGGFLKLYFPE
jgi:hypothetical protein